MGVFVFQSVPGRYDLRREIQPGRRDTWYATRYRSEMKPGDPVFFWMGGDESHRGLYGWGLIASEPYLKSGWDSHGVDVTYEVSFPEPVLAKSLSADPTLGRMLIFRAPQATNFLLSDAEARRLVEFVGARNLPAPAIRA